MRLILFIALPAHLCKDVCVLNYFSGSQRPEAFLPDVRRSPAGKRLPRTITSARSLLRQDPRKALPTFVSHLAACIRIEFSLDISKLISARSFRGGDSHGHSAPQAPGLEGKIRALPSEYIVIGIVAGYYGVYKLATSGKKEEAAPAPAHGH